MGLRKIWLTKEKTHSWTFIPNSVNGQIFRNNCPRDWIAGLTNIIQALRSYSLHYFFFCLIFFSIELLYFFLFFFYSSNCKATAIFSDIDLKILSGSTETVNYFSIYSTLEFPQKKNIINWYFGPMAIKTYILKWLFTELGLRKWFGLSKSDMLIQNEGGKAQWDRNNVIRQLKIHTTRLWF